MQWLGAIYFFILALGLLFLVLKWPQGKHATFSAHAAAQQHTIFYYNFLFAAVLPPLVLFFIIWFVPTFHLPTSFLFFLILSSVLQYIVTIIPEVGGWRSTVHRSLAFLSAIFLLPPMVFIIFSENIGLIGRTTAFWGFIVMLTIAGLVVIRRTKQKYLLYLQIGYFAAFFSAILAASYL
jgi:hypothetical protein